MGDFVLLHVAGSWTWVAVRIDSNDNFVDHRPLAALAGGSVARVCWRLSVLLRGRPADDLQWRNLPLHIDRMAHGELEHLPYRNAGDCDSCVDLRNRQNSRQHPRNGNKVDDGDENVLEISLGRDYPDWLVRDFRFPFHRPQPNRIPRLRFPMVGRRARLHVWLGHFDSFGRFCCYCDCAEQRKL